jgi:hypothetical protein
MVRQACRDGSTGSPRTDEGTIKNNLLAVRPELVEGSTAKCGTGSFLACPVRFGYSFTTFLNELKGHLTA